MCRHFFSSFFVVFFPTMRRNAQKYFFIFRLEVLFHDDVLFRPPFKRILPTHITQRLRPGYFYFSRYFPDSFLRRGTYGSLQWKRWFLSYFFSWFLILVQRVLLLLLGGQVFFAGFRAETFFQRISASLVKPMEAYWHIVGPDGQAWFPELSAFSVIALVAFFSRAMKSWPTIII